MKLISILLFCIFFIPMANAQDSKPTSNKSLKIAYLGSIIYPGFKVGLERPYRIKQINKKKNWGTKTIIRERALALNLGFYHHQTFHDNLYLLGEWQFRRQQPKGMFYEFAPGLGYSRTFLGGTTYKVDDNGVVSKQNMAGYNYAMASIAGGLGYDFSAKKIAPIKVYVKTSLLVMAPYNSFIYPRPTIELGLIYKLKSFLKPSPKFISKNK
jgi:hypothetical protein